MGQVTKALIRMWSEAENRKQLSYFQSLNSKGGHYTIEQKEYAVEKAKSIGIRTIQRWLSSEGIVVKRCQDWVYDWAYWRRKERKNGKG